MVPSTILTAAASSAAAGKNPWLPFGVLFLVAGLDAPPDWVVDPTLHRGLHGMAPSHVYFILSGVFLTLAVLESIADKVSFIERWLTPISAMWRPLAAVVISVIIGVSASRGAGASTEDQVLAGASKLVGTAPAVDDISGVALIVLTTLAGLVFGALATIGKVGTRLLLSLVPVPALRFAHSFVDDVFALVVSVAGLVLADEWLFAALALAYLALGVVLAPLLSRLALIHYRIGWAALRKAWRRARKLPPPELVPPRWFTEALGARGLDAAATPLPAYVYRAEGVGWCRSGWLAFTQHGVHFGVRRWWRPALFDVPHHRLGRMGVAESVTARDVVLVERLVTGGLRDVVVHLFPLDDHVATGAIEAGARSAGLSRVRPSSESARSVLPGFAARHSSGRFIAGERAGNLKTQATFTLGVAIAVGVISGGVVVPVGAGYVFSPFWRRLVFGICVTAYLSLAIVGTMGLAWPVAVLYAAVLNAIALRDLARQAIRVRVEGFVDREAFLPPVCGSVWIAGTPPPGDRHVEGEAEPLTDGSWRAVLAMA